MASQDNPNPTNKITLAEEDPPDPIPDKESSLQELCLTPPREAAVHLEYSPEVAQVDAKHNMLMKVRYSGSQSRVIPLEPLKKALRFYGVPIPLRHMPCVRGLASTGVARRQRPQKLMEGVNFLCILLHAHLKRTRLEME